MALAETALHPRDEFVTTGWGVNLRLGDIRAEHMDVRGIAESLAKIARWNGHTPGFLFSVADHSVLVSMIAEEMAPDLLPLRDDEAVRVCALAGLLHDGHETVIADRPSPVKRWERWRGEGRDPAGDLANSFDAALFAHAGLPWPLPPLVAEIVHHADLVALTTENRDLRAGCGWNPTDLPPPLPRRIVPSPSWMHAQESFLRRWTALTGKHG